MNRLAQGVVLLLLGAATLRASFTDLYLRYVKESLQPFLIAASLVLVVAGAITLWYEWPRRPGRAGTPDASQATEPVADDHAHHGSRVGWLLVAPVLGLLLVAPPALGSYTATTAGTAATPQQVAALPPLPAHLDPVPLAVLDYVARALWEEGRSLAGRRVLLTGFLVTDRERGETYLARLTLSCCAADARPIKVGLAGDAAPVGLADDTWVEVTGTYVERTGVDPINEATITYLQVESFRQVETPRQPYE